MATQEPEPNRGGRPSETGWDRIRWLLTIRPGDEVPEELTNITTTVLVASITGFLFGGMIGARHAADKYILMNHGSKFTSTMQAQRELHGAAMLGFVRQGSKWGWKIGLFAGIYSGTQTALSVYRDKDGVLNYVGAGALTGGLFRVRAGLKPTIGGTALGALLSLPVGLLMHGLDLVLVGREQREQMRREKYEARLQRQGEWKRKLDSTSTVIHDLETGLQSSIPGAGGLHAYYTAGPPEPEQRTDPQTALGSISEETNQSSPPSSKN